MINESLYPLEFERFKAEFIQMRVDNTVAAGGDGEQIRADLIVAFDSGWRPPQHFEMWVRSRSGLPLANVAPVQTTDGIRWVYFPVDEAHFRVSKQEAEELAFEAGFRLE